MIVSKAIGGNFPRVIKFRAFCVFNFENDEFSTTTNPILPTYG